MIRHKQLGTLVVASLFAVSLGVGSALAAGEPDPRPTNPPMPQKSDGQPKAKTGSKKKKEQKSEQQFLDGYRAAYALVEARDYQAAFVAFKALEWDDHPDVATELGYVARKLGDYDASKYWYERALAADPVHVKTWQYYGMWQVEQGNLLKAHDYLNKIEAICGNKTCKEYQDLKGGIEGTVTY